MNNQMIEIDNEMPNNAEERLTQLGYCVANLVDLVVRTMQHEQRVHPAGVVQPVESKIITVDKPGEAKKVRLVAVMLPIDLAMAIRDTAVQVAKKRSEIEPEVPGAAH